MAQQTLTSVSSFSGTEDTVASITYATLKLRANESAGTNAFKITIAPAANVGVLQYSPDGGTSWVTLLATDYAAGVWYSSAGVTVGGTTYAGSLRFSPTPNFSGTGAMFSIRASSAVGVDADLSSTDVGVNINVTGTQDAGGVSVSGAPALGQLLTATATDADGISGSVSYQWQVNTGTSVAPVWSAIGGATATTFTRTSAETGKEIRVQASYTDALGKAETVYSTVLTVYLPVHALRVWTGSAWVDATVLRRYDGVQWVDVPLSALRAMP